MIQKDNDRLYRAINELRTLMLEKFESMDRSIAESRQQTDQSINSLRRHADQCSDSLRQKMDWRFDEFQQQGRSDKLRRQTVVYMRWIKGLWLISMGLLVAMGGRFFGMY